MSRDHIKSERHAALDAYAPSERFCCDGRCDENQGHGGCPRLRPHQIAPPRQPRTVTFTARITRWWRAFSINFRAPKP